MADATFTFRVDEELKSAFSEAARARDQSGAQLLRGFMRDYIRHQQREESFDAWFVNEVKQGLAFEHASPLIASDEVEDEFTERRARTAARLAKTAT
jgi:predicted transcriptional regulator